jgi:hypothetical protein
MMRTKIYFIAGVLSAMTFGALANIPVSGSPSGSTAITPDVSEIRAMRHEELSFDNDLKRLSDLQGRYRENLPRRERKASTRVRQATPRKTAAKKPGVAHVSKRGRISRG